MRPLFSLDSRLVKISELIEKGALVADIGTDHALLPIWLIKNGICKKVIASDIIDGPLKNAEKNIFAHSVEDSITLVKSDGLINVCKYEPENIIIAGMGGESIVSILSGTDYPKDKRPLLILQPMTHIDALRRYLFDNGYEFLSEQCVKDAKRIYVIITARYKGENAVHYYNTENISRAALLYIGGLGKEYREYLLRCRKNALCSYNEIVKSPNDFKDKAEKLQYFSQITEEIDRRLK